MKTPTYRISTLGCRTNQYESAAYQKQLQELGYQPAQEGEEADVCVINTCTVTQSADTESHRQLRQLQAANPQAKIFVTGCASEKDPTPFVALGNVTVASNENKHNLLELLVKEGEELPEFSIEQFPGHTRAFVKIQDGCNSYCSYCIIPFVRGRSRSKEHSEIIKEVQVLISQGYQEIVLTGINIGDYDGGSENKKLAHLVRDIDALEGIKRLRISSIDPDEVDEELLEAVVNGVHTSPSMHIVLQSGSNIILNKMRRKYSRQVFLETCRRLQQAHPDFTFTTDVIVGFPGETEQDHQDTLDLIEQIQFAKVHMFPYSDRPKTRASRFPDKISKDVLQKRKRDVLEAAEKSAFNLREKFLKREMTILLEAHDPRYPQWHAGHTENFLYAQIPFDPKRKENTLVKVVLEENTPEGFLARVIE